MERGWRVSYQLAFSAEGDCGYERYTVLITKGKIEAKRNLTLQSGDCGKLDKHEGYRVSVLYPEDKIISTTSATGTIADYRNPYELPQDAVIGDGPFLDKTPDEVRAMLKPEPMDIPAIKEPAESERVWQAHSDMQICSNGGH